MNELNKINGIKEPKLIKEKTTGKWSVCFEYTTKDGKRKRGYYSKGLNDSKFFHYDIQGSKKVDGKGIILKNIKEREALAKRRIERLNQDLDNYIFNVNTHRFILGDSDRELTVLMDEYVNHKIKEGKIKQSSINQYQSKINGFKNYLIYSGLSSLTLKTFTKSDLLNFYNYLLQPIMYGEKLEKKAFSKRYRDDYHRFFVAVYNYLIDFKELNVKDVTKQIPFLTKSTERTSMHKATDEKDVNILIRDIQNYDYHLGLLFEFIFYTMHRIETLTYIQLEDIDLEQGKVIIPSHKMKTGVQCTISIEYTILPTIKEYLNQNIVNQQDYLFGRDIDGKVCLFGQKRSRANTFSSQFSAYKKNAIRRGFALVNEKISLYSGKFSGIKRLLDSGLSPEQVITITGHTSVEQLGTYAKDYKPKPIKIYRVED